MSNNSRSWSGASRRGFMGLVGAGALAAHAPRATHAQETPTRGGIARISQAVEPPMLVSAFNSSTYIALVSTKVLEGLVEFDDQQNARPLLAERWEISPDGKTYTFRLRQNVTWHDGRPFTSADVQFSAMKVWKELHPRSPITWGALETVDTPDAHTAIFRLARPVPFLMAMLGGWESQVIAKHIYDNTDIRANPANNAPVGTGPFVFREWRRGDFVRLERNANYWQQGRPYLDQVIIRMMPDAGARAAAFEAQEVHAGFFSAVSLSDVRRLAALPHIGVDTKGYDMFAPVYIMEVNNRHPILRDKRVRHAIMHAIDRRFIIDNVWFGYGKAATGPIASASPYYTTEGVPQYPFDVARANAILDEAGHRRGAGNMRFKLTTEYGPGAEIARTAEFMKQALTRVGIDLELRSSDLGTFIRRVYTDYDFNISQNWLYTLPDPSAGVQRLYYGPNIRQGVAFANASGFGTPALDALWEQAQVENEPARRRQLFHQAQRAIQEELPNLTMFEMQFVTIFNKRLRNHTVGADGGYYSLRDAYLAAS